MNNNKIQSLLSWPIRDVLTGSWNKEYKFDQNAPFSFKLVDSHIFMNNLRFELKKSEELNELYSHHLDFMAQIQSTKIWLKINDNIMHISLTDVYNSFINNLKSREFEDQLFNCNEVSFVGPMGPFKHIPLIQCINKNVLDKFVLHNVLKSKLPTRSLRVITKGHLVVSHGEDFRREDEI